MVQAVLLTWRFLPWNCLKRPSIKFCGQIFTLTPNIMTMDNEEASIVVGRNIPSLSYRP